VTLIGGIVHRIESVIRQKTKTKKGFRAGDLIFVLPLRIGGVSFRPRRIAICLSETISWENAFGDTRGIEVYFPDAGDVCLVSFDIYRACHVADVEIDLDD